MERNQSNDNTPNIFYTIFHFFSFSLALLNVIITYHLKIISFVTFIVSNVRIIVENKVCKRTDLFYDNVVTINNQNQ